MSLNACVRKHTHTHTHACMHKVSDDTHNGDIVSGLASQSYVVEISSAVDYFLFCFCFLSTKLQLSVSFFSFLLCLIVVCCPRLRRLDHNVLTSIPHLGQTASKILSLYL